MENADDNTVIGGDKIALEINLDCIDDQEFDIPPVDKAPTLESILNAADEYDVLVDGVNGTEHQSSAAVVSKLCCSQRHPTPNCIIPFQG